MTIDEQRETRDRLIKVETDVEHMASDLRAMEKKISAMHDVLMQAKGARWIVVGFATIGGAAAALIAKLLPFWTAR